MVKVTHLLLGGGGLSGFEMMGVIHGLQWRGMVDDISHVASISIGTYFAAFLMMNVDAMVARRNLMVCLSPSALHISPLAIFKLPYKYHLVNIAPFLEPLIDAMRTRWPNIAPECITLKEFCVSCKRDWHIIMTNLTTSRPVVASCNSSFAETPVLDLIRASMGLPLILPPVWINGSYYVDGGLTCDNPMFAFRGNEPNFNVVLQVVIAKRDGEDNQANTGSAAIRSIGHYIQRLMNCSMWHKTAYGMHQNAHVVTLHNTIMPLLPLRITKQGLWIDITPEKIEEALVHGLDLFESWVGLARITLPLERRP